MGSYLQLLVVYSEHDDESYVEVNPLHQHPTDGGEEPAGVDMSHFTVIFQYIYTFYILIVNCILTNVNEHSENNLNSS